MKLITVFGMIVGGILIVASFFVSVPKRELSNPPKYIGGDAYNYQIEASILGGEIAGAKTTKALYLIGGIVLLFGSLISFKFSDELSSQNYLLQNIANKIKDTDNNNSGKINVNNNSAPIATPVSGDSWVCKKCGERNTTNSSSCKGCGAYK
jgi:ribosomal protein L40E